MLESIYIGMTGLMGYSQGLRIIANNTANINTPGFKGSIPQFASLLSSNGNSQGSQVGHGLTANGAVLNFRQGELRQTNNDLDLAVDGQGLFTLKDREGKIHYTRAGQFQFDANGVLVNRTDGAKVMAFDNQGNLAELSIANLRTSAGQASSKITFSGNLSSTAAEQTVSSVNVFDAVGGEHKLSLKFTLTGAEAPGSWNVEVLDGATSVGTGKVVFSNGVPTADTATMTVNYTPPGQTSIPLTLDFSTGVTSFASGNLSTLAMNNQDGFSPASLTKLHFDNTGTLILTYANGQTAKGGQLALGRFDSLDAVAPADNNTFDAVDSGAWHAGVAGSSAFGSVKSGVIEISNVDLVQEFGNLVVMQRGYQASSQIVSTANGLLEDLFAMKGK